MKLVKCVDNEGLTFHLTVGMVYQVLTESLKIIKIINDFGEEEQYDKKYFKKI